MSTIHSRLTNSSLMDGISAVEMITEQIHKAILFFVNAVLVYLILNE